MCEAHSTFEAAGADQVTISGKSLSLAKRLQENVPFRLLLDPNHTARSFFGIDDLTLGQTLSPTSAKNYGKSLGGIRNGAVRPSDARRTPAVVILDAEQNVAWTHVGKALGDYPTMDELAAQIPTS